MSQCSTTQVFRCEQCGECCKELFGKRFGAALLPQEVLRLIKLAAPLGITLNFMPLTKNLAGVITTYQWTDNKCPFLDVFQKCRVYDARPMLCRAYPCMPYGVGYCHRIAKTQTYSCVRPSFDAYQIAEGKHYMQQVAEQIKKAIYIYNINKSRWEINFA